MYCSALLICMARWLAQLLHRRLCDVWLILQDRATVEQALDPRTRLVLFKLLNRGLFSAIHGCVSTGKEANVYCASAPESTELAIKVYKTSILVFKDRDRCGGTQQCTASCVARSVPLITSITTSCVDSTVMQRTPKQFWLIWYIRYLHDCQSDAQSMIGESTGGFGAKAVAVISSS